MLESCFDTQERASVGGGERESGREERLRAEGEGERECVDRRVCVYAYIPFLSLRQVSRDAGALVIHVTQMIHRIR
jgi:hypothetical protein